MLPASVPLVTYAQFKNYRSPNHTLSDASLVKELIERASRAFETMTGRAYVPYQELRYYDHPADARCLLVGDDLLAVTSIYTDNGTQEITADQYFPMCGDSYNVQPFDRLVIKETGGVLFDIGTSYQQSNVLTAIWGYSESYPSAWWPQDTLGADINATVTTFTTNDSTVFEWGQVLKMGDEMMLVTDATVPVTPTVRRGIRGTTAALHSQDDEIYIWQVHSDIIQTVLRFTDYLYTQKDSKDGTTDRDIVTAAGVVLRPAVLPKDIMAQVYAYRMPYVGVAAI